MAAADVAFSGDTNLFVRIMARARRRTIGSDRFTDVGEDEAATLYTDPRDGFQDIVSLASEDVVEVELTSEDGDREASQSASLLGSAVNKDKDVATNRGQVILANVCFLLIGVGVAMSWTVCRAGIAYFSGKYPLGPGFYTIMQICYNVPVLPLLIAQMLWDAKFDAVYGSVATYRFRFIVSMVVMAGCLLIIPYGDQGAALAGVALVGVFDSVAFGTAAQFFSAFPATASGYYFTGASLTSLISIGLTFATGFVSDTPSSLSVQLMYFCGAGIVLIGLAAALVLIASPIGRYYLAQKDSSLRASKLAQQRKQAAGAEVSTAPPISNKELFRVTLLPHVALFFCWFGTNWVDSLISYVPSQYDTPEDTNKPFRLIVLYASLLGELAGKQFNIVRKGRIITGPPMLVFAVVVRFVIVLPFLLYVLQPFITADGRYAWRSDGMYAAYQALFDMSGAYFSTLAYAMAAKLLLNPVHRTQSSTLLAITLMIGVYAGLGTSIGLARALAHIAPSSLQ